jgi:hypothetical protein
MEFWLGVYWAVYVCAYILFIFAILTELGHLRDLLRPWRWTWQTWRWWLLLAATEAVLYGLYRAITSYPSIGPVLCGLIPMGLAAFLASVLYHKSDTIRGVLNNLGTDDDDNKNDTMAVTDDDMLLR